MGILHDSGYGGFAHAWKNASIQLTVNGKKFETLDDSGIEKLYGGANWKYQPFVYFEIVGDPLKHLTVTVEYNGGRDDTQNAVNPGIWISSGYPWDGEVPETTKNYIQLRADPTGIDSDE